MFLSASDVCQIPFWTFISLGLAVFNFSVCLCLSLPLSLCLSLAHMKRGVGDMSVRSLITITELYNRKKRNVGKMCKPKPSSDGVPKES